MNFWFLQAIYRQFTEKLQNFTCLTIPVLAYMQRDTFRKITELQNKQFIHV